jgi:hypothetical protein
MIIALDAAGFFMKAPASWGVRSGLRKLPLGQVAMTYIRAADLRVAYLLEV